MRPLNKSQEVLWKVTLTDKAIFSWIKKKKRGGAVAMTTLNEFSTSPVHEVYLQGLS